MNIALIAEYLALATTLTHDDTPETYRRANAMAFEIMMEEDAEVWHAIVEALRDGRRRGAWAAMRVARHRRRGLWARLWGLVDPIDPEDVLWHAPNAGRPGPDMPPEKPPSPFLNGTFIGGK